MSIRIAFLTVIITLITVACSTINPYQEEPEISVDSFNLKSANSLSPIFEIGLRVINPNKTPLNIEGLSYSATVEGKKVLSGVNGEAFNIAGYSEETLTLQAKADVISAVQLFTKLLGSDSNSKEYSLRVKMDVGSFKIPIVITKKGTFSLLGAQ